MEIYLNYIWNKKRYKARITTTDSMHERLLIFKCVWFKLILHIINVIRILQR